jgi:serine protease Do
MPNQVLFGVARARAVDPAEQARGSRRARRAMLTLAGVAALAAGCHSPRTSPVGQTTLTSAEVPFATPPVIAGGVPDIPALVARVSPSVVNITATQEVRMPQGVLDPFEFFFGPGPSPRGGRRDEVLRRRGLGSGFIVDSAGHVVTNAHVVENASEVRVTLSDEREFEAKVKGRDKRLDLAVLELRDAKNLPHATLGHSDDLRVGQYVVAIGNPFGLGNTVTMGIISAKGRELGAGPYDDFIQTDASINPGNSGGPLFNLKGEVVGISTAINPAGQGIGFAIPVDALRDIVPQLLEKGSVSRGRLGVMIQAVDATLAKALGLPKAGGALVGEVEVGSPAAKAGIEPGDVIVGIDQAVIERAHDLPRLIARRAPGTKVSVKVMKKGGATRTVETTLDELRDEGGAASPARPTPPASGPSGGLGLELGDAPSGGVVVRAVNPGSAAADDLRPGDTILEVDGAPVKTAREASQRIASVKRDRPVLLKVQRNGRTGYVAVERK